METASLAAPPLQKLAVEKAKRAVEMKLTPPDSATAREAPYSEVRGVKWVCSTPPPPEKLPTVR